MNIRHLEDRELDAVLAGEALPAAVAEHLAGCIACRRRRDTFLDAVAGAAGEEPDSAARNRIRAAVLAQWPVGQGVNLWRRYALGLAAAIVLAILPLLVRHQAPAVAINADAVLSEVDETLARDPLAAFASEAMVNELVPAGHDSSEGSRS